MRGQRGNRLQKAGQMDSTTLQRKMGISMQKVENLYCSFGPWGQFSSADVLETCLRDLQKSPCAGRKPRGLVNYSGVSIHSPVSGQTANNHRLVNLVSIAWLIESNN